MAFKKINFQLVSPYIDLDVRDFEVDFSASGMPKDILAGTQVEDDDATATDALVDGEWMQLTSDGLKVTRATAGAETPVDVPSWPLYAERGRTELMALNKVPLIWRGSFEVDTHMYKQEDSALAVGLRLVAEGVAEAGGTVAVSQLGTGAFYSVAAALAITADAAACGRTIGFVTRPKANNGDRGMRIYCSLGLGL